MAQDERTLLKTINRGRTFFWLPILDFYILREFLIPFSVLCFTFTLLFLIGDVFNDLSDFLEYKASPLLAAKYFILKMPAQSLPKIANRILTVVRPLLGSIILLVFFD